MANDAVQQQGKDTAKAKDHVKAGGSEPAEHGGIIGAAQDAWHWGRKKAEVVGEKVGETSKQLYHDAKEKVQSPEGQAVIKKGRDGAATAIETVGGRSNNHTVNEITKNAKLIPGAGNIVNAAETLSKSGVTGIVRDGRGTVDKEVLIRGAVKSAPITGDAARLKNLADRTGMTETIVDKVGDQVKKSQHPEAHSDAKGKAKVDVKINTDGLVRGAVEHATLPGAAGKAKELSDHTGFTGRMLQKMKDTFSSKPANTNEVVVAEPKGEVQERQKVKR